MTGFRLLFLTTALTLVVGRLWALDDPLGVPSPAPASNSLPTDPASVTLSTTPLGSPYYRHLAAEFNLPIKELVKFERKGFGRSEIIELILLAKSEVKPLKDLGNRRIKDKVPMETLAKEAGLSYPDIAKVAQDLKKDIESRGDKNLPPPVFDVVSSTAAAVPTPKPKKKKNL